MKTPRLPVSDDEKANVCHYFNIEKKTIKEIAQLMGLSRRTVGRILVQAGHKDEPIRRTSAIMHVLKHYGLDDADRLHIALAYLKEQKDDVVRDYVVNLEETAYNKFLADVIHLREAKRFNSSVSNAMLQLSKKAHKNGPTN